MAAPVPSGLAIAAMHPAGDYLMESIRAAAASALGCASTAAALRTSTASRPADASVNAKGNCWCAMHEGGRVLRWSQAGEQLQDIPVPAKCSTMPCFDGPDLKTLFVTTAQDKRPAQELEKFPDSGCAYSMRVCGWRWRACRRTTLWTNAGVDRFI